MPLVELASSAGLATGYFRNFVFDAFLRRNAMKHGGKTPDGSASEMAGKSYHYSHFVMLEPEEIERTEDIKVRLAEMSSEPEIERLGMRHENIVVAVQQTDLATRTRTFGAIGPYLYGIPTARVPSTLSQRYRKIAQWRATASGGRERLRQIEKREREIKRVFFMTVRRLAEEAKICRAANDVLRVMTVSELKRRLLDGTVGEPTPL